jgi:hypothetical protein
MSLRGFLIIYTVWMTAGVGVAWVTALILSLVQRNRRLPMFIQNRLPAMVQNRLATAAVGAGLVEQVPDQMPVQQVESREDLVSKAFTFVYALAIVWLAWAAIGLTLDLLWWGVTSIPTSQDAG